MWTITDTLKQEKEVEIQLIADVEVEVTPPVKGNPEVAPEHMEVTLETSKLTLKAITGESISFTLTVEQEAAVAFLCKTVIRNQEDPNA